MDDVKFQQTKTLFNSLSNNEFSVFYATDKITTSLLNKARISLYSRDKVVMR